MIVLGLDTALASCSVAILQDGAVIADLREPLARGHAERLAPMAAAALQAAGVLVRDLDRVGVVIGPGGFAGVRVGLAFARGLALGTKLNVVGVTSLAALAAPIAALGLKGAVIDARRGEVYAAFFDARLNLVLPPFVAPPEAALDRLADAAGGAPATICGDGAPLLGAVPENFAIDPSIVIDAKCVAALAAEAQAPAGPPAPLYLRAPDAKAGVASRFAGLYAAGGQ